MIRTAEEIKATLDTPDKAMKACTAVAPSNRPNVVRTGCTCPTCKPPRR